ncbi:MAG: DUF4292 domain-containing protein [bacterium]|nr:DUF4292 domain-containing protein [bacterium]
MKLQTTILVSCLLLISCASAHVGGSRSEAASTIRTLQTEGTLSVTGTQNLNGIPFSALLGEDDSSRITMSGPFGMTAVRFYSQGDSFTVVNYLSQEVASGKGDSATVKTLLPIAMNIRDLVSIIRGEVPGGTGRFTTHTERPDNSVLHGVKDEKGGIEFALIDSARNVLRQYQRKSAAGVTLVDVLFDDFRAIPSGNETIPVAHSIRITIDDKKESLTLLVSGAKVNEPILESLTAEVPSSFKRVNYR